MGFKTINGEPRRGERSIGWGVSPRNRAEKKGMKPQRGGRINLSVLLVAVAASFSVAAPRLAVCLQVIALKARRDQLNSHHAEDRFMA